MDFTEQKDRDTSALVPEEVAAAPSVMLRSAEAHFKDVGHGVARMDPDDMRVIGASVGDVVEIVKASPTAKQEETKPGRIERKAVAKLLPTYLHDRGRKLIFIDGILRESANAGVDEKLRVRKTACHHAIRVVLKPRQPAPMLYARYLARLFSGLPVTKGMTIRASLFGAKFVDFDVMETSPAGAVLMTAITSVGIKSNGKKDDIETRPAISYEDVGGLHKELQRIRELIELPLKYPQVFNHLGIDPPKGVLLYGPPGTGKTLIARAVAHEAEANFFAINGPEIIHKWYGESERHLKECFEKAARSAPAILFIDEIDAIAPKRANVQGEVEKRVVATLLAQMDGLRTRGQVIVIGATNIPDSIDPALRRPGRFDREIRINVPDRAGRAEILRVHTRGMPLADDVEIEHVADATHGFVGADLAALAREAAMSCIREAVSEANVSLHEIPLERLLELKVTFPHFREALKEVEPSGLREYIVEVPDVSWKDVGGIPHIKTLLQESVQWPLIYPRLFECAHVPPPKGVLLDGPPGCGKTLIAKALASESGANFISVRGSTLMSKYVGDAEKGVHEIFKRAKAAAPCIIFLDEIDSLVPARSRDMSDSGVSQRVVNQFLSEMDGIEELRGVTVLGATNRRDLIDPAMLRAGRFDLLLTIPVPDACARREIFTIHTANKPIDADGVWDWLVAQTEGMTGSDIETICRRAGMNALHEFIWREGPAAEERLDAFRISETDFRVALRAHKEERT